MTSHAHNLISAIDHFLTSKINSIVSSATAGTLYVSAKVGGEAHFNYEFLFKLVGAIYITMQIVHLLFKFYTWIEGKYHANRQRAAKNKQIESRKPAKQPIL